VNILLDFDKTLTCKDTLIGFYLYFCKRKPLRYFFLPCYLLLSIIHKFRIISNTLLKETGVWMFVRGFSKIEILELSEIYAQTIKLSDFGRSIKNNIDYYEAITISSASFSEYINFCFNNSNLKVISSEINYKNGIAISLAFNNHGINKEEKLFIDSKYYDFSFSDSKSDNCFMKFSKIFVLVK
jgi:hypothetical protein